MPAWASQHLAPANLLNTVSALLASLAPLLLHLLDYQLGQLHAWGGSLALLCEAISRSWHVPCLRCLGLGQQGSPCTATIHHIPEMAHNWGRASPPRHPSPPPASGASRLHRPVLAPTAGGAPRRHPPQQSTSAGSSREASRRPPARAGRSPGAAPPQGGGPSLRGLWRSTSAQAGQGGCPPSLQQACADLIPAPVWPLLCSEGTAVLLSRQALTCSAQRMVALSDEAHAFVRSKA